MVRNERGSARDDVELTLAVSIWPNGGNPKGGATGTRTVDQMSAWFKNRPLSYQKPGAKKIWAARCSGEPNHEAEGEAKSTMSGWSAATFEGNVRNGMALRAVSGLSLDVDGPTEPLKDIAAKVAHSLGVGVLWHTSISATEDCQRGRLFVPFAEPIQAAHGAVVTAHYRAVVEEVMRLTGPIGYGSRETKSAAQFWISPAVWHVDAFYLAGRVDGPPLSHVDLVARAPELENLPPPRDIGPEPVPSRLRSAWVATAVAGVASSFVGLTEGRRSNFMNSVMRLAALSRDVTLSEREARSVCMGGIRDNGWKRKSATGDAEKVFSWAWAIGKGLDAGVPPDAIRYEQEGPSDLLSMDDVASFAAKMAATPVPGDVAEREVHVPAVFEVPGRATWWLRTEAGDFEEVSRVGLRAKLRKTCPSVALTAVNDNGDARALPVTALVDSLHHSVSSVVYRMGGSVSSFTPSTRGDGGTLEMAVAARRTVEPVRNADCEAWLLQLFGDRREKGLDWLSTADVLSWPSAALYMKGPKGCGKGMMVDGLSALWGGPAVDYQNAVRGFNADLLRNPIVFLDEGLPSTMAKDGSAPFRKLISSTRRTVEPKGKAIAELYGAVRVVVAANNYTALPIEADLDTESLRAIGERVLMVDVDPAAGEWLHSRGSRELTGEWVEKKGGGPGVLVQHIAWLIKTRGPTVARRGRFLVTGEVADWIERAPMREDVTMDVYAAIIAAINSRRPPSALIKGFDEQAPVLRNGDSEEVAVAPLWEAWSDLIGGGLGKRPDMTLLGKRLKAMSTSDSPVRRRESILGEAVRTRRWTISRAAIHRAADEIGLSFE